MLHWGLRSVWHVANSICDIRGLSVLSWWKTTTNISVTVWMNKWKTNDCETHWIVNRQEKKTHCEDTVGALVSSTIDTKGLIVHCAWGLLCATLTSQTGHTNQMQEHIEERSGCHSISTPISIHICMSVSLLFCISFCLKVSHAGIVWFSLWLQSDFEWFIALINWWLNEGHLRFKYDAPMSGCYHEEGPPCVTMF